MKETVHVVDVPMFHRVVLHVTLVQIISRHCHLRPIEDARFIHVVPCVEVRPAVRIKVRLEELGPLVAHLWVAEVRVHGVPWPTPALILAKRRIPRQQIARLQFLVDCILGFFLDVRINYRDKLALGGGKAVKQLVSILEMSGMPCKILLAIGVLDVQPKHVVGNTVLVKIGVHCKGVLHIHVVPPRLVFAECRHRWHAGKSCHCVVLFQNRFWRGTAEDECIQNT
mmetsp:Transcript_43433/g.114479  ORF Transcript_43433/g.114479 Transcript_43433/m.114479 type:complete len:226 (+) Transcript_43433:1267-1944(+)